MSLELLSHNSWMLLALVLWELIWKGLALYTSARNSQKYWFAAILFINSAGILPIIYLAVTYLQKKELMLRVN